MKIKKLSDFMEIVTANLTEEGRLTTAHVYRNALFSFRDFLTEGHLWGAVLSAGLLKQYEEYLLDRQLKLNTCSTYLRMLRATYNKAAACGWVDHYLPQLFRSVYTGTCADVKRAIAPEVMGKLLAVDGATLPETLQPVWAAFCLMFLLRGMPFVDLVHLRKSNLKNGVITYCRHKTGRWMTVKVPAQAALLIESYRNRDADSPYLFPFLSPSGGNGLEEKNNSYQLALRKMNYQLASLSCLLRLGVKLSSYTPRHTWATMGYQMKVAPGIICNSMGHSSIKVTETYLKPFQDREINATNDRIISYAKRCFKKADCEFNVLNYSIL